MKKNILRIMLGSIIVEVLLICIFILTENFNVSSIRALSSVGIIFAYSIPCLVYSRIYDRDEYKYIAAVGVSIACCLALIEILIIWEIIAAGKILTKIIASMNNLTWGLVFISLILSFASVNDLLNLFKKISISLIAILNAFVLFIIWAGFPGSFMFKLFLVILVLTVGSLVCTSILIIVHRKELIRALQIDAMSNNDVMIQGNTGYQLNNVQSQQQFNSQPVTNFSSGQQFNSQPVTNFSSGHQFNSQPMQAQQQFNPQQMGNMQPQQQQPITNFPSGQQFNSQQMGNNQNNPFQN